MTAMPRIAPIDIARGLAVIAMIFSHAADAFLADRWKSGSIWEGLSIFFGFIAPAFLFLSGLVLALAIERRDEPGTEPRRSLSSRMIRLVLLGYWLQIPAWSLTRLLRQDDPGVMTRLFDVNILQIIGVSGLIVLLAVRLSGSLAGTGRLLGLLAVTIVIATPLVWALSPGDHLPFPFRSWLVPQPWSTFPLFPFVVYPLAGFLLSTRIRRWCLHLRGGIAMTVTGVIVAAGVRLVDTMIAFPDPWNDLWGSSPLHILFRLGGVMVIIGAGSLAVRIPCGVPAALIDIGRASLAMYILHLTLIYGSPATMGGRYWFDGAMNRTLGPIETTVAAMVAIALSYLAIWTWREVVERRPLWKDRIRTIAWTGFWGVFLLNH